MRRMWGVRLMPAYAYAPQHTRPDWSMLGFRTAGQYAVICSDQLIDAVMETETDYDEFYSTLEGLLYTRAGQTISTLSYRMREYTIFVADSYAAAFRMAAEHFTPRERRSTPIEGRRSLAGGAE